MTQHPRPHVSNLGENKMQGKKLVIPIIFVVVMAGLAAVILFFANKSKQFTIPDRSAVETQIKKLGYNVDEWDKDMFKFLGIEPYTRLWNTSKNKDERKDVNIIYARFNNNKDAVKAMEDYYNNAAYLKNKHKGEGKVKIYYDKKKNRAYAMYDLKMNSDGFVENFAMVENSGNLQLGFAQIKVDYIYGGIYMDGNKVISITTTNPQKKYDIGRTLEELGLPKP